MARIPRDPTEGSRRQRPGRQNDRPAPRGSETALAAADQPIIHGAVPPRDVLLRFITENPDRASKREIAKAFGLKAEARVELKDALRALEDEGYVEKKRKSLTRPGALPPVTVLDITTRDKDGELIARPPTGRTMAAWRRPY